MPMGHTLLWEALNIKNWDRVAWLIERGADLNQKVELHPTPITLLAWACRINHFDMALRLLDLGADARISPEALRFCIYSPLFLNSDQRQDEVRLIRRLLREGVDAKGNPFEWALSAAMITGDWFVVGILQAARVAQSIKELTF